MVNVKLDQIVADLVNATPADFPVFHRVFSNDQLAIAILGTDGRVIFFNAGAEKITGVKATEAIGRPASFFFDDSNGQEVKALLQLAEKKGFASDPNARLFNDTYVNLSITRIEDQNNLLKGSMIIAYDQTQLNSTQKELNESHDFFRKLLLNLPDAVVVVDRTGRISFCSENVEKVLGITPEEIQGKKYNDQFPHLTIVGRPGENLEEIIRESGAFEGRLIISKKDGSKFNAAIMASSLKNDTGDFDGWIGSIRDDTDQVKAENMLSVANHLLAASSDFGRFISEGLPLPNLINRFLDSLIVELRLQACCIYLLDEDSSTLVLKGQRNFSKELISEFSTVDFNDPALKQIKEKRHALKLINAFDADSKYCMAMMNHGYDHSVSLPLVYRSKIAGYLILMPEQPFNKLELMLIESLTMQVSLSIGNVILVQNLHESEKKYSTVVEWASDGIMISQNGKFKFVNKRLADMLGYKVSEIVDMDIINAMDPDQSEEILQRYNARIRGVVPREMYEGRLLHKDGRIIPVEFNACTITYDGHSASLSYVRDISQRLALQNRVLEQKEMAEFYNDVLTHDINNFCHTMLGQIDTLVQNLPPNTSEDFEARLGVCKNSVRKISHIIDRVRELMHIQILDPDNLIPQNLNELIEEAVDIAHETFPGANVQFDIKLPKNALILGHDLVVLVFLNLLTNAIKHNDKVEIQILVEAETTTLCNQGAWKITVTDNGPNIPADQISQAFLRYQRFSTKSGKGLGLAIVRALVDKLSGAIEVELPRKAPMSGLCISVLLPKA